MSDPAYVPMDIYQGEDYTTQIIWTDWADEPVPLTTPCRLDVKDQTGYVVLSLINDGSDIPDGTIPDIAISDSMGLIQIHITREVTAAMPPGQFGYDLFVTVDDGGLYASDQATPLIYGPVNVSKRITIMT